MYFPRHLHPQVKCEGFTLIELLVSISIISLLIAILIPTLTSVRLTARLIQCQSQQRQMGIALHVYENDWQMLPYNLTTSTWNARGGPLTLATGLVLSGYLPADDRTIGPTESGTTRSSRIMRCPGDPNRVLEQYHLSYFYRANVLGSENSPSSPYNHTPIRSWDWPGPYAAAYSKWLVADAMRVYDAGRQPDQLKPYDGDWMADNTSSYPSPDWISLNSIWHREEGANVLFHDGHVNLVPYGELLATH